MTLTPGKLYCLTDPDIKIMLHYADKRHYMRHDRVYLLTKLHKPHSGVLFWFLIDKLEYGTLFNKAEACLFFKEYIT